MSLIQNNKLWLKATIASLLAILVGGCIAAIGSGVFATVGVIILLIGIAALIVSWLLLSPWLPF